MLVPVSYSKPSRSEVSHFLAFVLSPNFPCSTSLTKNKTPPTPKNNPHHHMYSFCMIGNLLPSTHIVKTAVIEQFHKNLTLSILASFQVSAALTL